MAYLDNTGLSHLWDKIKAYVTATIPSNLVTGSSQSYTIWAGSQADYSGLAHDSSTLYFITDGTPSQTYTIWTGTESQYNEIVTKDASTIYFIV